MPLPKSYRSIEDFEREELRPQFKVGFSYDDLMIETTFEGDNPLLFDDQYDEYDPANKDDDDD